MGISRRGFLTALGLAGPAGAALAVSGDQKIKFVLHCQKCDKDYPDEVILNGRHLSYGTPQCPKCLQVLPYPDDLGERIFKAQGLDKYGRNNG